MYLEPLAQMPTVLSEIEKLAIILQRSLQPAAQFHRIRQNERNDLELVVLVHGLNALTAAKALRRLADCDVGLALMPHVRSLFEAVVRIRWMRATPHRATDYLSAEPFERYRLATDRVRRSRRWRDVVTDCEREFNGNLRIRQLRGAVGSDGTPDYVRIAKELRVPDLRTLSREIGMDDDDYFLGQAVPSLSPHGSAIYTKTFFKRNNADGSAYLSHDSDPGMLIAYCARGMVLIGVVTQEVLGLFPEGAVEFDLENEMTPVNALVTRLNAQFEGDRS